MNNLDLSFRHAKVVDREMIHKWLTQDYIAEWIHGVGLENTYKGLELFFKGEADSEYFIVYDAKTPFAFFITYLIQNTNEDQKIFGHLRKRQGDALAIDMFICDKNYLGKGHAHFIIKEFLLSEFPRVEEVFIDPEATNTRAIRVYEKAGFKKVEEFIAPWHPVPHIRMRLDMQDLVHS